MRLRISSRKSDLARLQSYLVGKSIQKLEPRLEIEYIFKSSLGDINLEDPLWKMPEKGVFTEDFKSDLSNGTCDLVVHSWKDLPIEENPKTVVAATLPRADARDLVLFRRDFWDHRQAGKKLRVFSSSPRRIYNLTEFFTSYLPIPISEVEFVSVRGNMATRVRKFLEGDCDALVLAKAAIDRLLESEEQEFQDSRQVMREAIEKCRWLVTPLSLNPAAAAQGAVAIEVLRNRTDILGILQKINCVKTFEAVLRERALLKKYGGGCHQKIGATSMSMNYGDLIFLRGLTDSGLNLDSCELNRPPLNWPKARAIDNIYPSSPATENLFDRKKNEISDLQTKNFNAFFVSRETAWPDGLSLPKENIVWVSGTKTWKSLAAKGVWVNGTQDSLGEKEDFNISTLLKVMKNDWNWLKLSHNLVGESSKMPVLSTYELIAKPERRDLGGKTHFFWMSGTAFFEALKHDPSLVERGFHACGPGHTFETINSRLRSPAQLQIFLNYEQWRREVVT